MPAERPALAQEIDAEVYVAIQGATEAEATGDLSKARQLLEAALPQAGNGSLERALGYPAVGLHCHRQPA
ncbi:hypothetical protein UMZ34_11770 [Halopseudomonas pachastrellae]|nr:hypothetical protein UMZ34_11770 [Halopseudomonas pachastrellae]